MILFLLACDGPDDAWLDQAAALQHARCASTPTWSGEWRASSVFEAYTIDLDQGLGWAWWSIRANPVALRRYEERDTGLNTPDLSSGCEVQGLVEVRRVSSTVSTAEFALELRTYGMDPSSCPLSRPWMNATGQGRRDLLHLERDAEDPEVLFLRTTSGRHVATGIDRGGRIQFGTVHPNCIDLGPRAWP